MVTPIVERQEVSEGRVIEGRDMTFHAPVYGEVLSDGGLVRLEDSLGWGRVVNPAGHIRGRKRAFNATLQAQGGVVVVSSAESCLIIGREVRVQSAVKCQIFAHTLHLGTAAGCLIAGRSITIDHARDHRHEPNLLTMVVPELPDLDELLQPLQAEIAELSPLEQQLAERINTFKADKTLSQYLSIRAKVRTGLLTLSEDQAKGFAQMTERLDDAAKALEAAVAERRPLTKALASAQAQVQALRDEHAAKLADSRCQIARVEGETIVRRIVEHHDSPDLSAIDLPLIPKILFRNDASLKVLCNVHKGKVDLLAGRDF